MFRRYSLYRHDTQMYYDGQSWQVSESWLGFIQMWQGLLQLRKANPQITLRSQWAPRVRDTLRSLGF